MKKTFSVLLVVIMIMVSASTVVFADDVIMFGFDTAVINDGVATVPVYLSAVPEGLNGISSVSFRYTFDEKYLTYQSTTDGVLKGMENCNAGVMMWFEGDESKALQNADIGKEHPLFYVNFKINDTSEKYTILKIALTKLTDYDLNAALATEGDYKVSEGVVVLNNESGGESGDGSGTGGSSSSSGSQQDGGLTPGGSSDTSGNSTTTNPGTSTGTSAGTSSGNESGTATTPGTSTGTPTEAKNAEKASDVFSDVADDNWAAKFALNLYNKGILSGDNQGRANLENRITREETSKLALLVNGIEPKADAKLDAADASAVSDWALSYMATAVEKGIFSGYEDGSIRPSAQITREEMVAVIIKSLGVETDENAVLSFADNSSMVWSKPYVAKAVELGFVNGYEDDTFRPTNPITRAEAFAIFSRVLDYKAK